MSPRSRCLVLLTLTLAAYHAVWSAGFVYEDVHWQEALRDVAAHPHPDWNAAFASLTITNAVVGTSPRVWHLVNLAGHLVNGGLVYALLVGLVPSAAALFGAGLFLLHPLNSEAVSYVAERTEIVSTGLVLIALLLGRRRVTVVRTLLAVGLVYLALLAKASAVVGVVLVPLVWARAGWSTTPGKTRALAVGAWLGLVAVVTGVAVITLQDPYTQANAHGALTFAALQAASVWRYLGLLVWPVGFSVDHDIEATPIWLAGVALAGLIMWGLTAWDWRRRPAGLALAWVLLALAPRFLIRLPEYLNEHQLYLASVGLALLAASAYTRLEARCPS